MLGQWMKDRWKQRSLLFKTLFHLSRYDFRFPRYPHVKKRIIFNRLLFPSLSHIRTLQELSLIYLRNLIKIRETLNRYNFEDNNPRSMGERSLETGNLAL